MITTLRTGFISNLDPGLDKLQQVLPRLVDVILPLSYLGGVTVAIVDQLVGQLVGVRDPVLARLYRPSFEVVEVFL